MTGARAIDDPGSAEQAVPGWWDLDVDAALELHEGLWLEGRVENALDELQFPNADDRGVPLPGPRLLVTLRWSAPR